MTDLQGMAQYQALLRTRSSVLGSAVLLEIVWGEESDKELYLLLKDFVFDSGAASHGAQTSSVLRGQVSSRLPLWLRRWSDFVHQANSMVSSNPVESTRLYVRSCGFDASNWQASLNAAAVRLQLANDSDQSFQFVLLCHDIESRWHVVDSHVLSDGHERSATVHSRFITADRASKRIIVVDSLSLISRCTRRLSPVSLRIVLRASRELTRFDVQISSKHSSSNRKIPSLYCTSPSLARTSMHRCFRIILCFALLLVCEFIFVQSNPSTHKESPRLDRFSFARSESEERVCCCDARVSMISCNRNIARAETRRRLSTVELKPTPHAHPPPRGTKSVRDDES